MFDIEPWLSSIQKVGKIGEKYAQKWKLDEKEQIEITCRAVQLSTIDTASLMRLNKRSEHARGN